MAQRTILIDELDGPRARRPIRYSFDGRDYEIDLSEKNAEKFRKVMQEYVNASRPVEAAPRAPANVGRATGRRQTRGGTSRTDLTEIRKWAQEQGMPVADRGRIKQEIVEAYDEAHK